MKTRISPTRIEGLVLALILASVPVAPAQNGPNVPAISTRDAPPAMAPAPATPAPAAVTEAAPLESLSKAADAAPGNPASKDMLLSSNTQLSYWTSELVKLDESGIEEDVLLAFIDSAGSFNLSANQIIHLAGLGLSTRVIIGILQHDFDIASGARTAIASVTPSPPPPIRFVVVPVTKASKDAREEAAAMTVPSAPANVELPKTPTGELLTEVDNVPPVPVPAEPDYTMPAAPGRDRSPAPAQNSKGTAGKAILYPVREPYPVQITDPIVLVRMAGQTPNLFLIEPFP